MNLMLLILNSKFSDSGYYNTVINSSYAKLIDDYNFELIFNIDSGTKIYFGKLVSSNFISPD